MRSRRSVGPAIHLFPLPPPWGTGQHRTRHRSRSAADSSALPPWESLHRRLAIDDEEIDRSTDDDEFPPSFGSLIGPRRADRARRATRRSRRAARRGSRTFAMCRYIPLHTVAWRYMSLQKGGVARMPSWRHFIAPARDIVTSIVTSRHGASRARSTVSHRRRPSSPPLPPPGGRRRARAPSAFSHKFGIATMIGRSNSDGRAPRR